MKIFGIPVIGVILPRLWKTKIHLNRDGSFVDTGRDDIHDEVGPLYVKPLVFEWLGFGMPLTQSFVYDTKTNKPVVVDFGTAG